MKIIKAPPTGPVWTLRHACNGWGNGGKGCGAELEIEREDLRYYVGQEFPWRTSEPAVSFKCPICGKLTDIGRNDWPVGYNKLKKWSSTWQSAKPKPPQDPVSETGQSTS